MMYEICIEELKLIPISKNPYACSAIIPVCQHSVQSCHAAIKNSASIRLHTATD
ncbi:MAG: hypothetical protein V8S16_08480 [Gemmiger sp.]